MAEAVGVLLACIGAPIILVWLAGFVVGGHDGLLYRIGGPAWAFTGRYRSFAASIGFQVVALLFCWGRSAGSTWRERMQELGFKPLDRAGLAPAFLGMLLAAVLVWPALISALGVRPPAVDFVKVFLGPAGS